MANAVVVQNQAGQTTKPTTTTTVAPCVNLITACGDGALFNYKTQANAMIVPGNVIQPQGTVTQQTGNDCCDYCAGDPTCTQFFYSCKTKQCTLFKPIQDKIFYDQVIAIPAQVIRPSPDYIAGYLSPIGEIPDEYYWV